MAGTGYSGTPLLKKLGIKTGFVVWLLNAPADYFRWLEKDISPQLRRGDSVPDWAHLFAADRRAFETGMRKLEPVWQKNKKLIIWVSWYKKSSGLATDLGEDHIRKYALGHGLVDIKVCAVSEEWSGLKLVVPVALRSES